MEVVNGAIAYTSDLFIVRSTVRGVIVTLRFTSSSLLAVLKVGGLDDKLKRIGVFIAMSTLHGVSVTFRLTSSLFCALLKVGNLDVKLQRLGLYLLRTFACPVVAFIDYYVVFPITLGEHALFVKRLHSRCIRAHNKWRKIKRWLNDTFAPENSSTLAARLFKFAKLWEDGPGYLRASYRYEYVSDTVAQGYVRVKFRWREPSWRKWIGRPADQSNPFELAERACLTHDFRLEEDGSLDLKNVEKTFHVEKLDILSPNRIEPFVPADPSRISSLALCTLSMRDGFVTVIEHEDNITRARKVFHQWIRGSLMYFFLRWITLLLITSAVVGPVTYLAYTVDLFYIALLMPAALAYGHFYANPMIERHRWNWTPWPQRRARGWVSPKFQPYL